MCRVETVLPDATGLIMPLYLIFSGTPMVTASLQSGKDRQNGYMVRCVRNEIPESRIGVGIIVSPSYQGTEASGNSYFWY